jgi:serine/threonine protein kinase
MSFIQDNKSKIFIYIKDVKGSHILVTKDYIIKLIDFGVAGLFSKQQPKRNSSVGTSLWMAPVRYKFQSNLVFFSNY